MKIPLSCMQCSFQSKGPEISHNFVNVEITDNGVYKLLCDKGHGSTVFLQQQQFEILFELGAMALLDGYTREAVASFAASLERFYEFCIKMILENNEVNYTEVEKSWKLVTNQSERQLGAFYFLYLNKFNTVPPTIEDKRITFRNGVIHKGKIPRYDEVYEYAKYLYEYMFSILHVLRKECWESFGAVTTRIQSTYFANNAGQKESIQVMSIPTMFYLSLADELFGRYTFDQALDNLRGKVGKLYIK